MKAGFWAYFFFAAFLTRAQIAQAKYVLRAKAQPNRLTFHLGYSDQCFSIPTGADFTRIRTRSWAVSYERKRGFYTLGVQYSVLGPANLESFWINSATEGQYQITFERYQLLTGFRTERVRYLLVVGLESAKWMGAPELNLKKKLSKHFGLIWAYDAFARPRFRIPVTVTVLSHPGRKYEFGNYTSATIEAAGGIEYALGMGVAFGF